MDRLNSIDEVCRAGPFADALQDNLELLTDLLEVISDECVHMDERAAGLLFEGIAAVVEAFAQLYLPRGRATGLMAGGMRHFAIASRIEAVDGG